MLRLPSQSPRRGDCISYDAQVADYWPEFAQAGKESVTVRQLLSHQAGLAVIRPPLTLDDLANPTTDVGQSSRRSAPLGRRGRDTATTRSRSAGTKVELIRRTDPAARSLGQFFADEVAKPLGLDFYIGLPASVDRSRLAYIHGMSIPKMVLHLNTMPPLSCAQRAESSQPVGAIIRCPWLWLERRRAQQRSGTDS